MKVFYFIISFIVVIILAIFSIYSFQFFLKTYLISMLQKILFFNFIFEYLMLSIFIKLVFSYHLSIRKAASHKLTLAGIILINQIMKISVLSEILTFVDITLRIINNQFIKISFISLSKSDCSLRPIIQMLTAINIIEFTAAFF